MNLDKNSPDSFQRWILAMKGDVPAACVSPFSMWEFMINNHAPREALAYIQASACYWLRVYVVVANTRAGVTRAVNHANFDALAMHTKANALTTDIEAHALAIEAGFTFDQAKGAADVFRRAEALAIQGQRHTEERESA